MSTSRAIRTPFPPSRLPSGPVYQQLWSQRADSPLERSELVNVPLHQVCQLVQQPAPLRSRDVYAPCRLECLAGVLDRLIDVGLGCMVDRGNLLGGSGVVSRDLLAGTRSELVVTAASAWVSPRGHMLEL